MFNRNITAMVSVIDKERYSMDYQFETNDTNGQVLFKIDH